MHSEIISVILESFYKVLFQSKRKIMRLLLSVTSKSKSFKSGVHGLWIWQNKYTRCICYERKWHPSPWFFLHFFFMLPKNIYSFLYFFQCPKSVVLIGFFYHDPVVFFPIRFIHCIDELYKTIKDKLRENQRNQFPFTVLAIHFEGNRKLF